MNAPCASKKLGTVDTENIEVDPLIGNISVETTIAYDYVYILYHYFEVNGKQKLVDTIYFEYFHYRTQSGFLGLSAPQKQLLIISFIFANELKRSLRVKKKVLKTSKLI